MELGGIWEPNVFLVYRGPTGSVPWTAVGFVFSGAFEDHRSAGLWWSVSPSGGGHGRFLKSFLGLIIIFGPRWCCRGLLQMVLIWAAMGDSLGLFSLASSSSSLPSSLVAAGAAADRFLVTEFCCGLLDNSPWTTGWCGGPALFHIFWALADVAVDRFLLVIYHV
uniref:Uncharacterized protein n=1 Tax=Fagus sylvatica TaxID=28930 RepID=A0A2N9J8K7_FAGSY